jgi:hypothetical protein
VQITKSVSRCGKEITKMVCPSKSNGYNKEARKGKRLILAKHTMYVPTQNKIV